MNTYIMRQIENEIVKSVQHHLNARVFEDVQGAVEAIMDLNGVVAGKSAKKHIVELAVRSVQEKVDKLLYPDTMLKPEREKKGRTPQDDFDAQIELEQVDTDALKRIKERLERRIKAINTVGKSDTDKRLSGLDRWQWELNHVNAELDRRKERSDG